ncbi:MAG: hypothetical protein A3F42_07820 [Gammaproteobacteria bacterium RIFCSPHIGHO2_12_FULL_37_34]|nr:MAG: hypothetical protein A3F42_07820 [Gammaproteobacteria bacterium RIFCSPHIGHO2_12_FULL_37_34]
MAHGKDIDTLLDLDGVVIEQAGGYWTKFEVRRIAQTTERIPHGIRYSLTLHDRHGERMMGFDNAHVVKVSKKGKHRGRKTYDHRHRHAKDEGVPYEFVDAYQLLKDFWSEVDKTLSVLGIEKE